MKSQKRLLTSLAMAAVLAGPLAAGAAETAHKVKCEITKNGKTEIKHVKDADECTKMGGTVVPAHKKK
jgi:Ni/Co efflux regulator RcnB